VTFEDGTKAIFKTPMTSSYRNNVPTGTEHLREVAAYEVAKIVGMGDMVPATVLRTMAFDSVPITTVGMMKVKGVGSLQTWVPKAETASYYSKDSTRFDGMRDRKRAATYDFMIGNLDRHTGNWMVREGGKLALIDHGLSFPTSNTQVWSNREMLMKNLKMPVGVAEKAAWAKKWPAIERSLSKLGIEKEAMVSMKDRYNFLMRHATKSVGQLDSFLMGDVKGAKFPPPAGNFSGPARKDSGWPIVKTSSPKKRAVK